MKLRIPVLMLCAGALGTSNVWAAQEPYVYPNQGQTSQQQQADKDECYSWARNETRYDPRNPPRPGYIPQEEATRGGVMQGAARGAIIGGIADDEWGKGAAIGGLIGGIRRQEQRRELEARRRYLEEQQQAEIQQWADQYYRAYGACLDGRGYTVR